ncbi:MAG TPA: HD-GYP domain-containing protein [Methylomirabilota bacterium]|nr:HD-GYP domain-containing protein [Methylomirabilota bacterium]
MNTAVVAGQAWTARHRARSLPGIAESKPPRRAGAPDSLLELADLTFQASDLPAFADAVLGSVLRNLNAQAGLILVEGPPGGPIVAQRGAGTLVRHLHGFALEVIRPGAKTPLAWTEDPRGPALVGAVASELGQGTVVLCAGRDSRGGLFPAHERKLLLGYARATGLVAERVRLQESVERQSLEIMAAFVRALASRSQYLEGHSVRVALYATELALTMGLPPAEVSVARRAGMLHDLGKLATPDAILLKPVALTEEEYACIKHHPEAAARMLAPYPTLRREAEAVKSHHERYDGTGYPNGLRGTSIPVGARIVSVADAFDAMTSDRPYRRALPLEIAMAEVRRGAGTQFDPEAAAAWLALSRPRLLEIGRQSDADTRHEDILEILTATA